MLLKQESLAQAKLDAFLIEAGLVESGLLKRIGGAGDLAGAVVALLDGYGRVFGYVSA